MHKRAEAIAEKAKWNDDDELEGRTHGDGRDTTESSTKRDLQAVTTW